jgi:hypothetical protein
LPAYSSATTNSVTNGLSTKFSGVLDRAVKRIATRQIDKKKLQGDAIAADHAERDTNKSVDAEVNKLLLDANSLYYTEVLRPGTIRGILPAAYDLSSDSSAIRVSTLVAGDHQVGAPAKSHMLLPTGDVGAQVHQTCVNNLLANYLGGKTYSIDELKKLTRGMPSGNASAEPQSNGQPQGSSDSDRQILVTLDPELPMEVLFDEGNCSVTVRARTVQIDGRVYSAMNISLRFKPEQRSGKWFLVFDGQPVIVPPRLALDPKGKLSGPEVAVRRILRNTIVRDLPELSEISPFALEREAQTIGWLLPNAIQPDGGWLALSANFAPL